MKKILLIALVFSPVLSLFAQNVEIPDANFKSALLEHNSSTGLGTDVIDSDGDGEISIDEANAYYGAIYVSKQNIADLTGLQEFPNITSLWCNGNKELTEIDLSKNVELLEINCGGCNISQIDLTHNTKLLDLRCGGNKTISSIDLSNLPDLEILWCNNNSLTKLDVSKNPKLWQLYCYANKLSTLDISMIPGLVYFNAQENELSSIDLSKNINLELINVSINKLTSLDISNNINLDALRYRDNPKLGDVDITNNTQISKLQLWNTAATSLDLSSHTKIVEMECYDISTLKSLNFANGNNTKVVKFNTKNTPNLKCIQVDNVSFSTSNWNDKSPENNFSTDCTVGTNDLNLENLTIFPNPVENNLTILTQEEVEKVEIYNMKGQKVLESTQTDVLVSSLICGEYILKIYTVNNNVGVRQFVKK